MKKVRYCSINLCDNDSVDIRCGGPDTLGFNFHLDGSISKKEWESIIREELAKKEFPIQSIFIGRPEMLSGKKWSINAVKRCIRNYSI